MNIDEIVDWVDKNTWGSDREGGERCSYQVPEIRRLVTAAMECVPEGGAMLEVGVYGGRTLAALLCVAREKNATVWACDPFVWNGDIAEPHCMETIAKFSDVELNFLRDKSAALRDKVQEYGGMEFDLIHIDGDHYDAGTDCKLWLPLLKSGGIVVFHDVVNDPRSPVYEGVYCGIQPYLEGWEMLWWAQDEEGHQMGRRKPWTTSK